MHAAGRTPAAETTDYAAVFGDWRIRAADTRPPGTPWAAEWSSEFRA